MRALRAGCLCLGLIACSGAEPAPAAQPESEPTAPPPSAAQPPAAAQAPVAPADPNEACAQMILVAYRGAEKAAAHITRDRAQAEKRAGELLAAVQRGEDFAALAQRESDAKTSAARGGVIGSFRKDDWPKLYAVLRDPVFALQVSEVAKEPVAADYGFAIVRRCAVEKARSRHILIRYAGAKNAGPEVERPKAEAEQRARELLAQLQGGADFAELARSASEDGSAERGGDVGLRARGALTLEYENALFAMKDGERRLVESEFGFHVIERLPEAGL